MKLFILCLIITLLMMSACSPAAAPVAVSNSPVSINNIPRGNVPMPPSKPLPEMGWTGFDGKEQKLKDLDGKVVILDFWATNCPPCVKEIPHLMSLQEKYGAENIQVIGLHVGDDDDRKLVPAFSEKLNISYPLATPETELERFIFAERDDIPQTAIFDRHGIMVKKIVGFSDAIEKELDTAVQSAVDSR